MRVRDDDKRYSTHVEGRNAAVIESSRIGDDGPAASARTTTQSHSQTSCARVVTLDERGVLLD